MREGARAERTCVCQTQSPQAQVGGRVGDAAQAILYGVDGLDHCHVPKVKLRGGEETEQQERKKNQSTIVLEILEQQQWHGGSRREHGLITPVLYKLFFLEDLDYRGHRSLRQLTRGGREGGMGLDQ